MSAPTLANHTNEAAGDLLESLAHRASAVLNAHINNHGRCSVCADVAFPCEHALLAEHNVALL